MGTGSVKLVLRASQQRDDGTCPIYVRLIRDRRVRFLSTGIRIEPRFWDARRQRVRKSHPLAPVLNRRLENIKLQAQAALLEEGSADAAKAALKGAGHRLLLELGRQHARALLEAGKYWTHVQQRSMLQKLEAWRPSARLQDVTPAFVEDFKRWMERRGKAPATVRKNLQALRRVLRYAMLQGLMDAGKDPFLSVRLPSEPVPYRRRLSWEEVEALARLELPPPPAAITRARDAFLLAFFLGGMRFGDLARLRVDDFQGLDGPDPWVRYRMAKTGRWVELPVPERAVEIIARWEGPWRPQVFPFLRPHELGDPVRERQRIASMNATTNELLKKVARMAGLERPEEISFHCARHSFADLARKAGDLYAVSRALGHSALRVTQNYLASFDREAVQELAARLWDKKISPYSND